MAFTNLNLREIAVKKMTKLLTTFFVIALTTAIFGAGNDSETSTFIETYDDGTDVGLWHCSVNAPRLLEAIGGNPGAYIQQGGFSTAVPTWASISTRFQPGVSDPYKIDSIYTGDWTSLGVTSITVDLNVIQVATWATDRAVTLELLQMDETGFNVTYDATYTLPDPPRAARRLADIFVPGRRRFTDDPRGMGLHPRRRDAWHRRRMVSVSSSN